jgi:hypothetical protein
LVGRVRRDARRVVHEAVGSRDEKEATGVTPFVVRAMELLAERERAETPEEKRDVEERLAALIRANYTAPRDHHESV